MTDRARSAAEARVDRINGADVDGLLHLLTEDCVLRPPTGTTEAGKDTARTFYGGIAGLVVHHR